MKLLSSQIPLSDLIEDHMTVFSTMIKAVVDLEHRIMVVDAELHADQEATLLEGGSRQENLWGINLYPSRKGDDFIEFTSLINIRPAQGNPSMEVLSPEVRSRIVEILGEVVDVDT